jgi:uncharacterized protein (UPF0128 family)
MSPLTDAQGPQPTNSESKEGNQNAAKERENKDSNTTFDLGRGKDYTLARLDRDHPDLAKQVRAGELSANQAAIEAGFRVKSITIPLDPDRAAKTLRKHFDKESLDKLRQLL